MRLVGGLSRLLLFCVVMLVCPALVASQPAPPAVGRGLTQGVGGNETTTSPQARPSSFTFKVDSRRGWQSTSLEVTKGQQLAFSAVGAWTVDYRNFAYVGPNGYSPQVDRTIWQGCRLGPSLPYGLLLARVGDDPKSRIIGSETAFTADRDGVLAFRIHDGDACLGDNAGTVTVTITLTQSNPQQKAQPASTLLAPKPVPTPTPPPSMSQAQVPIIEKASLRREYTKPDFSDWDRYVYYFRFDFVNAMLRPIEIISVNVFDVNRQRVEQDWGMSADQRILTHELSGSHPLVKILSKPGRPTHLEQAIISPAGNRPCSSWQGCPTEIEVTNRIMSAGQSIRPSGYTLGSKNKYDSLILRVVYRVNGNLQEVSHTFTVGMREEEKPPSASNEILNRARSWIKAQVPYDQNNYHSGYRTDCSGFVSYAWQLKNNGQPISPDTVSLGNTYGKDISFHSLQPGDIINNKRRGNDGHVIIFVNWIDQNYAKFAAYEENKGYGKAVQAELTLISVGNGITIKEYHSFAPGPFYAQTRRTLP